MLGWPQRVSHAYAEREPRRGEPAAGLRGRVRLTAGQLAWQGRTGDLLVVPDARHGLEAIENSAILLAVSKVTEAGRP
jgi:quercetin dioxygenase-like cupin family protein